MSLSTDKILIAKNGSDGDTIDNAQWSDSIPVLVQAKLIEALENSRYFEAVSRPVDGFEADQQLLTELRTLRMETSPTPNAHVAISAKLMGNGRVIAARVFEASVPVSVLDAGSAVAGLNQAFGEVLQQIVVWTGANRAVAARPSPDSVQ
jgi:ABC-type uncharacterized transport system auxiliary subunit